MYKIGLKKAEGPEIKLPTFTGLWRKQENSRKKKSTSASLTTLRALIVQITTNSGKFLEMGVPDHCSCLLKNMYTGQEAKLELNMEQLTDSKLGKEYAKAVYRHLVYLTYMWSTSCEMPGSMNHKLESRLLGELSTTSDMQMIPRRKGRGTKEPLNEGARGE